jgi:hypothetical protein
VFNATFNNISVISWRSVLLVEDTTMPEVNPLTCHKSLTKMTYCLDRSWDVFLKALSLGYNAGVHFI